MSSHRKKLKSFDIPGHAHELTFSTFHRLPLLDRDRTRRWFIDALESARTRLKFQLWAYVIMPEHVHVLLWPGEHAAKIQTVRSAIKVPVAQRAIRYLERKAPAFLDKLREPQPDGTTTHCFWQRGGGFDRNAFEPATILRMIEYIHNNPVRRGLALSPTDWIWSSARFYRGDANVPIRMDPLPFLGGDSPMRVPLVPWVPWVPCFRGSTRGDSKGRIPPRKHAKPR